MNTEIPQGPYCYELLGIDHSVNPPRLKTKYCPHFKPGEVVECTLLKIQSKQYDTGNLLWDSVKECDINTEDLNEIHY